MTRIYRYILVHDEGMAPCPSGGFISLATCKPVIRRMARPGDWVVGFSPGSLSRGNVLWAGKVEQVLSHGDYQHRYPGRLDAIYEQASDGTYVRLDASYHPTQSEMDRDIGSPVLLFDRSQCYYFNGNPEPLPGNLFHLAAAGRGHRVNGTEEGDAERLQAWLENLDLGDGQEGEIPVKTPVRSCGPKRKKKGC